MKQLQDVNSRLKQMAADLSLDKTMLQDVLRKSGEAIVSQATGRLSTGPVPSRRAACLSCSASRPRYLSLPESSEVLDGVAIPDPGDW
jgi:putative transposase